MVERNGAVAVPVWKASLRRLQRLRGRLGAASNLTFLAGLSLILAFVFVAIAPQLVAPYDPTIPSLRERLQPPWSTGVSGFHLLGTDHLGRDLLTRMLYGARPSLMVGGLGVVFAASVGSLIGMASGYYRGPLDAVIMRLVDAQLSFPFIIIAIAWAAMVGGGVGNLVAIVAVRAWVNFARLARGQALSIRERDYVTAAMAIGATGPRILLRHILPNAVAPILVLATVMLGTLIIVESTLSYLGLGVQPPQPAWGSMLNQGRPYIHTAWWVVTFPGVAISLVVLSANMVGDSLRDILDPTLRGAK